MPLYATAQPFTLSTTVTNVSTGLLADPGALVLTYVNVAPGSMAVVRNWPTPAEIVKDNTGLFHYDAAALGTAGHYRVTWVATGLNAGEKYEVFDVFDPATYPRLVSLADAKAYVKLLGTADDALLDRMVGWASARILREVDAYQQTFTETRTLHGDRTFLLAHTPVQSITSLTPVGPHTSAVDVSSVWVQHPAAGIIGCTYGLYGTYTVAYVAGYSAVPAGVDGATLALIQHWWNQSQAHGSSTYGEAGFIPDFSGLPNTVKNRLAGLVMPGIA